MSPAEVTAQAVARMARLAGRALDRGRGIDSAGRITGEELGHPPGGHRGYDPSRWMALPVAMYGIPVGPSDVFADLGSGKGRVVIQAARRYRCRRVIGVELSPDLHRVASANCDRQRRLRSEVELVEADLTRWSPPPDLTVAYMYNPLHGQVFSAALERLLTRPVGSAPLTLVYVNPVEHDRVLATGRAVLLAPPPARLVWLAGLPGVARYRLRPG